MGKPSNEPPGWTSARCLRLLRPLYAQLESLRKSDREKLKRKCSSERLRPLKRAHSSSFCSKTAASFDPEDPEWSSVPARKRPRKTYSGRITQPRPGSPEVDSAKNRSCCSWSRAAGLPFSLSDAGAPRNVDLPAACPSSLAVSQKASVLGFHDGITSHSSPDPQQLRLEAAFRTVLRETQKEQPRSFLALARYPISVETTAKFCGTSSLTSLCARKVPHTIAWEIAQRRLRDQDDKTDVTFEVYNELEDLSATPNVGWPYLREVVRAHAVFAVCQAIGGGDLSSACIRSLVEHAVIEKAYNEAETLLAAWIEAESTSPSFKTNPRIWKTLRTENDDREPSCILELERYATKTHQYGFLFRQFAELLRQRKIQFDALSIKRLKFLWSRVAQSITEQPSNSCAAFDFIERFFLDAANSSGRRLWSRNAAPQNEECKQNIQDTVVNLGALIAALDVQISPPLGSTKYLRAAIEIDMKGDLAVNTEPTAATAILTASLLIAFNAKTPNLDSLDASKDVERHLTDLSDLNRRSTSHTQSVTNIPIPQITRLCARVIVLFARYVQNIVHVNSAFEQIRFCVSRLTNFAAQEAKENSKRLRRTRFFAAQIALETVLQFSELEATPEHTEFARATEERVLQMGQSSPSIVVSTPQSKLRQNSSPDTDHHRSWTARHKMQRSPVYRWDDGLCEWITKTPLVSKTSMLGQSTLKSSNQATAGLEDEAISPCRRRRFGTFEDLKPGVKEFGGSHVGLGGARYFEDSTLENNVSSTLRQTSLETKPCLEHGVKAAQGRSSYYDPERHFNEVVEEDELAYNLPSALPRPCPTALSSIVNGIRHTRHMRAAEASAFSSDGVYDELA